jgi:hypothetical protein
MTAGGRFLPMNKERNKRESGKFAGKSLSIVYAIFIGAGIISVILIFLDRQNVLIYSEIVYFAAFLFFLVKGISLIKNSNYKYAIVCFIVVAVYLCVEALKIFMYSGGF